jgi:hypothetical protein
MDVRAGDRPIVSTDGPQTQLTQQSSPELWARLAAATFDIPATIEGHSQVSPASSRAVFLADRPEESSAETSLAPGQRLEPVHLHGVHDTSLHLCLPSSRGAELIDAGWAELHQYGDFGTKLLVYGPRNDGELALVLGFIAESLAFARA